MVDLGLSPLCQTLVTPDTMGAGEVFYPLTARVCEECYLVQLPELVAPAEIFSNYPYFSSYSDSWLEHGRRFTANIVDELQLGSDSLVVELASNDGYLLQHFRDRKIPVLGVEPAENVADVARQAGIRTVSRFFGQETAARIAEEYGRPDLLIGNNVLAHVPDINDFVSGMKTLLGEEGRITMEFPHLQQLIAQNQFDTIYHEHFSYLSLSTVQKIFEHHGLDVFDVEELPTHGGSLRIHACHAERGASRSDRMEAVLKSEQAFGLQSIDRYLAFGDQVARTKRNILSFLIEQREAGKRVAGYGAPGKGNTLLNYCGIRTDLLEFTVDRSPHKHGNYTPGTRIPIYEPEHIRTARPDYLFILPWNLADEIIAQTSYIREWGGKWVIPIPEIRVVG
jgi:hypothetical protein